MLAKCFFWPLLLCATLSSCEAPPVQQAATALANTVWLPRAIAWVRPHPEDAELSSIQYADFSLLCFRGQGQFMRVSSYHSLGDGDTIIVATELGQVLNQSHIRMAARATKAK